MDAGFLQVRLKSLLQLNVSRFLNHGGQRVNNLLLCGKQHAQLVVMLTVDAMGHSNMGVLGRLTPLARRQLLRRHVASEEQVDGHPFGAG